MEGGGRRSYVEVLMGAGIRLDYAKWRQKVLPWGTKS